MRHALAGLAARGHDVIWRGGLPPQAEGVRAAPGRFGRALEHVDLWVGARAPGAGLLVARQAHARAQLIAARAADLGAWSFSDRIAWDTLPGYALVEESEAGAVQGSPGPVALARVALWSDERPPEVLDGTHADVEILERIAERALAARERPGRAAAFVDRDGTLIVERGYLAAAAEVELLPGVAHALRSLRAARVPVVVISNQAGVGRGLFPLSAAYATMAALRRRLREHGVELDSIRFCPHAPGQGCACRKPGTRLLAEAAEDLGLSLASSVMIGDKRLDAATGRAAGGMGVLVRSGYGRDEEARAGDGEYPPPDQVVDDFAGAAAWVIARHESL
jgi:D-glycero-D-manno-heptose 1,7-bisphosphate phosphatase